MQFYKHTGNFIFLVGQLSEMPEFLDDANDENDGDEKNNQNNKNEKLNKAVMFIERKYFCANSMTEKNENYRVLINEEQVNRINQFGFPGIFIFIEGEIRLDNETKIMAHKIELMHLSRDRFQDDFSNDEKYKNVELFNEERVVVH